MSERFVRGWKLSAQKLAALPGSRAFAAQEVLTSSANARALDDVVMSLGKEGAGAAERALTEIAEGRLDDGSATKYARVLELVLNHVAQPLAVTYVDDLREPVDQILLQWTYAAPNDTHARWNPLLSAAGLPLLANAWGAVNLTFPWRDGEGPAPAKYPWPLWTLLQTDTLDGIARELDGLTQQAIVDIPAETLADDASWVEGAREELWNGLQRLRQWVGAAKAGNEALVLMMDGDQ